MKLPPPFCPGERQVSKDIAALARKLGPVEFWPIDRLQPYKGKARHAEFAMGSGKMTKPAFTKFLTDAVGAMAAATANDIEASQRLRQPSPEASGMAHASSA